MTVSLLVAMAAACDATDKVGSVPSDPTATAESRTMKTETPTQAIAALVDAVQAAVAPLSIQREATQTRINRCEGAQGETRDDLFYAWVGLRGMAPGQDIASQLQRLHEQWQARGWTITRFRTLDNGGVNLAATDPATGYRYVLDSGFDVAPKAAVVGFFNTPCFQSVDGKVAFGDITVPIR